MTLFDDQFAAAEDQFLKIKGEKAVYNPNGLGDEITAIFTEQAELGEGSDMDGTFRPSMANYTMIEAKVSEIPNLAYQDEIERSSDEKVFTVRQFKKIGNMWKIYASTDERGAF